ncbi:hypothetical protein N4G69_20250 [Streptomyces mirabilis]|uniref:hypothetical protein n=1 Tax=Streptomyces mirabilis TaxID=68239 RepID=UPI0021BF58F5|nr:hypothetical protein [Streptomyces mirabilis]MCT9107938.1 hypothetical protein [Streptomyces mirabilis]
MSEGQRSVSVRRTPDFDEDLAVLLKDGGTASDAVRHAVRLIAQAHRVVAQIEAQRDGKPVQVLSIGARTLYMRRKPSDGSDQRV